jgi:DNA-binding PadR family transcriptional regulator
MGEGNRDRVAREPVAMHSQISWTLLGLIIERPSHGYELAKRFERIYADKLRLASDSHAYTALKALERHGLIETLPGTDTSRQKAKHRASAAGLAAYHDWMRAQVAEDRRRHHVFLLQMTALHRDPEQALAILADYEKSCLSDDADGSLPAPDHAGAMALQARLIAEEKRVSAGARVQWARYARSEIKAFARAQPSGPPPAPASKPDESEGGRGSDQPGRAS